MFTKGVSGNANGRPHGAKDKTNKEIREAFQELIEGNLANIESWLKKVAVKDPAKAIDLILKLSEFIVPKLRSVEMQAEISSNNNDELISRLMGISEIEFEKI